MMITTVWPRIAYSMGQFKVMHFLRDIIWNNKKTGHREPGPGYNGTNAMRSDTAVIVHGMSVRCFCGTANCFHQHKLISGRIMRFTGSHCHWRQ